MSSRTYKRFNCCLCESVINEIEFVGDKPKEKIDFLQFEYTDADNNTKTLSVCNKCLFVQKKLNEYIKQKKTKSKTIT